MFDATSAAIDPRYLTKLAAAQYEIDVFLERNPQYFKCDANKEALLDYITVNGVPLNVNTLEMAYRELKSKKKLVELPTAEKLAEMSAAEVKKFSEKYGTEEFDHMGRSIGYVLPQNMARVTADDEALQRRHRRTSANSVRDSLPAQRQYPQDAGKRPSRREFATWPADRLKEFLEYETPDGMLPSYLR